MLRLYKFIIVGAVTSVPKRRAVKACTACTKSFRGFPQYLHSDGCITLKHGSVSKRFRTESITK
jgi:hypothetical protein